MTTLAKKLDERFQKMDAETLRQVDTVFTGLLNFFEKRASRPTPPPAPYRLRTRSLGARPDLDLTKLAHADEDIEFESR